MSSLIQWLFQRYNLLLLHFSSGSLLMSTSSTHITLAWQLSFPLGLHQTTYSSVNYPLLFVAQPHQLHFVCPYNTSYIRTLINFTKFPIMLSAKFSIFPCRSHCPPAGEFRSEESATPNFLLGRRSCSTVKTESVSSDREAQYENTSKHWNHFLNISDKTTTSVVGNSGLLAVNRKCMLL